MTGCSRSGGSGLIGATTGALQATCATLTSVLLPTTATFAWANGRSSTVDLTFRSSPGSPNRLVMEGKVVAGARTGDRVDGGLHVSAKFTRTLRNAAKNHKRVNESRQVALGPLNGESGDCTVAKPIGTIKIASYQSLKFTMTEPPTTTTTRPPPPPLPVIVPSTQATTTTALPAKLAPARTLRPRVKKAAPPRRSMIRVEPVAANDPSDTGLDPASVLGVICIGAAAALLVLLVMPSRRTRRRRATARALR